MRGSKKSIESDWSRPAPPLHDWKTKEAASVYLLQSLGDKTHWGGTELRGSWNSSTDAKKDKGDVL